MGQSNISSNLKDRIARVMGEKQQVLRKIENIERLVAELPATREHLAHLDKVIDGIDVVLTDLDPTWSRETVIPIKPNGFRSPIPFGEGRRVALEVLQSATQKMTTREITEAVLEQQGLFDLDQKRRIKPSFKSVSPRQTESLTARTAVVPWSTGSRLSCAHELRSQSPRTRRNRAFVGCSNAKPAGSNRA
jgi:hypothetical protein